MGLVSFGASTGGTDGFLIFSSAEALGFDRAGTENPRRSSEIWLMAEHPGDARFKRAVQQAVLHFPLRNGDGAGQQTTFEKIPDQNARVETISLRATSDAGAKVQFFVLEGPVEMDGNQLRFTAVRPRAKLPIKVTVVAWQWDRSIEPKLKTAKPVEQTFLVRIGKPGIAPLPQK